MIKLNLGCGLHFKKGFINVDNFFTEQDMKGKKGIFKQSIFEKGAKFVKADIGALPFPDNYADYVELFNVIEHFPMRTVIDKLKEIYRVMKPKANFLILTNSMDGICADWLRMCAQPPFKPDEYINISEVIYGNQWHQGEFHQCPFTPSFLNYCLTQAGFTKGVIAIIPKHAKLPKIGSAEIRKGAVARNDLLYAEITK
jgi:SAM-dependent methyltransferase